MLKLSEVELKKNLLFVEEYPLPIAPQTEAGVHLSPEQVNDERARLRFRIGKIVKWGELDDTLVKEVGLKTQLETNDGITEEVLVPEQNIFYTADAVELVDYKIEGTERLLLVNLHNIVGTVIFEDEVIDEIMDIELVDYKLDDLEDDLI